MNDAVPTSAQHRAGAATERFRAARDFLLQHRTDYETAVRNFRWPEFDRFNWALDWFDVIARDNNRPALVIVEEDGRETRRSYAEMAQRSNRVATWLRDQGVARGDRIIVMLGNQVELWETILAAMKLGAVITPPPRCCAPKTYRIASSAGVLATWSCARLTPRSSPMSPVPTPALRWATLWTAGWRMPTLKLRRSSSSLAARHWPATRCCCISPPAPPRCPSWSSTRTSPTRSATCPQCIGSGCNPATCISTSPRPAGPSMPGAMSSRPGSPRPACSCTTTPVSAPRRCWSRSAAAA